MNQMSEFKNQSVDELRALYHDLSKEIFEFRNEIRINRKLEKPHALRKKKKDRARVMTAIRQKGGIL